MKEDFYVQFHVTRIDQQIEQSKGKFEGFEGFEEFEGIRSVLGGSNMVGYHIIQNGISNGNIEHI